MSESLVSDSSERGKSVAMATRVKTICAGVVASLAAFVPLFALFDWALVAYWEWQHEGRKMKFTLWADERALLFALSLCAVVFYITVRSFQRCKPTDQRFSPLSLVIAGISGVTVIYVSVLTYLSIFVGRLFSSSR
jgi:hypothetical protein